MRRGGGRIFFRVFLFSKSLKSASFSQKISALSVDDMRKYEDDMPGDLSLSHYTRILTKTRKKIRGGQNGKNKSEGGCYAKRSLFLALD